MNKNSKGWCALSNCKRRHGQIFGGTQKHFGGTQVEKHWVTQTFFSRTDPQTFLFAKRVSSGEKGQKTML